MKKENIKLSICLGVMILVSTILLILYQNFVPTTKIDKLFGQKIVLTEEEYVKEGNIIYKQTVKSRFGKELGVVYLTETKNPFGSIELYVAFDKNDRVLVADKKINQTETYVKQVRSYILKNYQGIYYENIEYIDGAAGATTIGVSRKTIQNTVQEVVNHHYGLVKDYVFEMLNEKYTVEGDLQEKNKVTIIKVKTQANVKYTIYKHTAKGLYYDGKDEDITVLIAVDESNHIKKYLLPEDLYKHSGDPYNKPVISYMDSLINKNIKDELPTPSGSTSNSRVLVKKIIEDIQGVIE